MAFALAVDFKVVLPQLRQMLWDLYSGWVQSAINERANQIIKDSARDNASKVYFLKVLHVKYV